MERKLIKGTNLQITKFGIGALTIGPSQFNMSIEEGSEILSYALNSGINVIDTAEYYETYPYVREAIKGINRSDIVISSKSLARDYDGMKRAIKNCLVELNTDYIDIFFLHEVRSGQFEERKGAWKALIEAKKEGIIKYIGISTHHTDSVTLLSKVKECDIVFALLNINGMGIRTGLTENELSKISEDTKRTMYNVRGCYDREGTVDEMLKAIHLAKDNGKVVYIMKAFGGGNLVKDYNKCLDFLNNNPDIDCIMVGMAKKEEVDTLISYDNMTLDKAYTPNMKNKIVRVNKKDCEGCGTCIKMCASNAISYDENGFCEIDSSKCITCGYCAQSCPARAILLY